MNRYTQYVIECRDDTGALDFTGKQPEQAFGLGAITGISEDEMASIVWRYAPDAGLNGNVSAWPTFVDPRFRARVKTW